MKKNEFEQQISLLKIQHELALEKAREEHGQMIESLEIRHAHSNVEHAHQIQMVRVMGEEMRSTISHAKETMMPMYEHLGSEQTYALLKGQIEQGVALVTHLGEKALAVAEKKIEVDGAAKLSRNIEDGMKTLLQEVHRVYWAGRDDADADADEQDAKDAAFADAVRDSIGRAFRDAGCEVAEDSGSDDDDDLVS